jgi:hypothetical protein
VLGSNKKNAPHLILYIFLGLTLLVSLHNMSIHEIVWDRIQDRKKIQHLKHMFGKETCETSICIHGLQTLWLYKYEQFKTQLALIQSASDVTVAWVHSVGIRYHSRLHSIQSSSDVSYTCMYSIHNVSTKGLGVKPPKIHLKSNDPHTCTALTLNEKKTQGSVVTNRSVF